MEELLLELDSDFIAANRSCMNFPSAIRESWVESVEPVDVELVDDVLSVEEVEPPEVEEELELGGGPLGGDGMEIPIWLNASMMLCIKLSLLSCCELTPETWESWVEELLLDCWSMEM